MKPLDFATYLASLEEKGGLRDVPRPYGQQLADYLKAQGHRPTATTMLDLAHVVCHLLHDYNTVAELKADKPAKPVRID